jgi:hypothetical protein
MENNSYDEDDDLDFYSSPFHDDLREYATDCIENFFKNMMMYCGGKIPKSLLFTEKRISSLFNLDIVQAVDLAYEATNSVSKDNKLKDIMLVNETLKLLAKSGIPKYFAGGMLLMYLEFCEGIDFD